MSYFEVFVCLEPRLLAGSSLLSFGKPYLFWYTREVLNQPRPQLEPVLLVFFYRTNNHKEPVRDWLKAQIPADRRTIGEDIKTVQFVYPVGMLLVTKTRVRFVGGSLTHQHWNCQNHFYGAEQPNDSAPWVC
jgi:hypothetical protein